MHLVVGLDVINSIRARFDLGTCGYRPGFGKFDCWLDKNVEHIRGGLWGYGPGFCKFDFRLNEDVEHLIRGCL